MAEVCIICHAEKSGERVADTSVIRAIRTVKERLNMATRNTLVVCPDCIEAHAKRLKSYERKMLMHAVFAAFIILLIIFVPLLAGSFNPGAILVGFIMGGLFIALPLLDYVPPLERSVGMTMMESRTSMAPKADARQTKAPAPLLQNPLSLIGARPKKAGGLADVKAGKPSKTPNRRR